MGLLDNLLKPYVEKALERGIKSGELSKYPNELGLNKPMYETPKAMFYDPYVLASSTNYKEKFSPVSYEILYSMAMRCEPIAAIISTRISQISSFGQPAVWKNKTGLGYQIRYKDAQRKPSVSEAEKMREMEEVIYHCGSTNIYRSGEKRPNFQEFIRRFTKDSLVYDQATCELIPDLRGKPVEWWSIDASTIRLVQPNRQNFDVEDGRDIVKYCQIFNNVVRHEFTFREMAFCVRNVDNNLKKNGYGCSELETIINMVTAILFAEDYNKRFFSQGQMINGIMNFKGMNVPPEQLEHFRRQWQTLASGVTNAHKIPIVSSKDGIEWISLHANNRDMEYSAWMEFLIKICCSIYLIDPSEIGFDYRGASDSAPLFESSPEAKLKHSRDKGLRTLLNFIEEKINFHIVQEINPDWFFEFVGIDMKDEQEIVNIRASEIAAYKTLEEVREEAGLEPLKINLSNISDLSKIPLNPTMLNTIIQIQSAKDAKEAQQQQMEAAQQQPQQGEEQGGQSDPTEDDNAYDPEAEEDDEE